MAGASAAESKAQKKGIDRIPVKATIIEAMRICYKNPRMFLLPAFIMTLPGIIETTIRVASNSPKNYFNEPIDPRLMLPFMVVSIIISTYYYGIMPILTARYLKKKPVSMMGAVAVFNTRRIFFSVILVEFLVLLVVAIGLLLLIVPGVIFGVWFMLSTNALVLGEFKGGHALRESKNLISPVFWRGALQTAVLLCAPTILFALLVELPHLFEGLYSYTFIVMFNTASYAVEILLSPVIMVTMTLVYVARTGGAKRIHTDLIY